MLTRGIVFHMQTEGLQVAFLLYIKGFLNVEYLMDVFWKMDFGSNPGGNT